MPQPAGVLGGWRRGRRVLLPCGGRLSGDRPAPGARLAGWQCVTGIKRADSANGSSLLRRLLRLRPYVLEQNDEYAIQKRYMGVESMAQLSENPTIRLPAAPALA